MLKNLIRAIGVSALCASSLTGAKAPPSPPPAFPAADHDPFCTKASATIMIVGTNHFSNPGLDSHNVHADDVLADRRQREIAEVAARLALFRPTKVMVEAPYRDYATRLAYRNYVAGKHALTDNEVEQLGFRIARMAGLRDITPIDFEMRMSGLRPDELDDQWQPKTPAPAAAPASAPASAAPELSEEDRRFRDSTIREYLLFLNDPVRVEQAHSQGYMDKLLPVDSPVLYEHPDYLANWYKRNFRMFANIIRETRFPDDRVLLIVGNGHLKIMKDIAKEADYFCLASALPLLS
jgi:hypothetical protein